MDTLFGDILSSILERYDNPISGVQNLQYCNSLDKNKGVSTISWSFCDINHPGLQEEEDEEDEEDKQKHRHSCSLHLSRVRVQGGFWAQSVK